MFTSLLINNVQQVILLDISSSDLSMLPGLYIDFQPVRIMSHIMEHHTISLESRKQTVELRIIVKNILTDH